MNKNEDSRATAPHAADLQKAYDIMHKALCEISQPADEGCSAAVDAESMRETAIDALSDAERIVDFGDEDAAQPAAVPGAVQADGLLPALRSLYRAYVNLLESGRNRIMDLGGDCDPVDRMEQDDPELRKVRAIFGRAATAAAPTDVAKVAPQPVGALVAKFDKGPWRHLQEKDTPTTYKDIVESNDFTHDVRLYVSGDFASLEQRAEYCKALAAALNAAPTESAAAPADRATVLEEAAHHCECIGTDWLEADDTHKSYAADYLAKAIRALATNKPATQEEGK